MPLTLPLEHMSRSEKLMAMESLWVDLTREDSDFDSPDWHGDALRETEKWVKEGKSTFYDWDETKERVRQKTAKLP